MHKAAFLHTCSLNMRLKLGEIIFEDTVIPVYNDHPWDPKLCSLLTGGRCLDVIYVLRVQNGGFYRQVVAIQG